MTITVGRLSTNRTRSSRRRINSLHAFAIGAGACDFEKAQPDLARLRRGAFRGLQRGDLRNRFGGGKRFGFMRPQHPVVDAHIFDKPAEAVRRAAARADAQGLLYREGWVKSSSRTLAFSGRPST